MKKTLNIPLLILTGLITTQSSPAATSHGALGKLSGEAGIGMQRALTSSANFERAIRANDVDRSAREGAKVLNGFLTMVGQRDVQLDVRRAQQTGRAFEKFMKAAKDRDLEGQINAGVKAGTDCCFTILDFFERCISKLKKKMKAAGPELVVTAAAAASKS